MRNRDGFYLSPLGNLIIELIEADNHFYYTIHHASLTFYDGLKIHFIDFDEIFQEWEKLK